MVLTSFDFELSVTTSVGDRPDNHPDYYPGDDQDSNQARDYTKKCERMRLKNEIEAISDFQIIEMWFQKEKQKLIGKIIKVRGFKNIISGNIVSG